MPFMSDITTEENEEGGSDNGIIKMKVCNVGTLQKALLLKWWHVNTFDARLIRYFNLQKEIIGYCYTITSFNQKQKLHKIIKNGLKMCKYKKVYTYLVVFTASIEHTGNVTPSGCTVRMIEQYY